jgi:hypothetical protein
MLHISLYFYLFIFRKNIESLRDLGENDLPELKVKRRGYWRGPYTYTRNGKVINVKKSWVPEAIYMTKDRGKPGRTPESDKFFEPKRHTGWEKNMAAATRRSKLLNATDDKKSMHDRYVEAGRLIQELANVTTDEETKARAKGDAEYFFEKARVTEK